MCFVYYYVPLQAMTHEELRERYNPEGSMLRRQQMRMLKILLEVDKICRKHDIRYWLSSGTLIGPYDITVLFLGTTILTLR